LDAVLVDGAVVVADAVLPVAAAGGQFTELEAPAAELG
jgi:hypothetical protein